jgi:hypothetical protein
MAKRYEGEHTEAEFSAWCHSKGYFRLKLQVDKSNRSAEGKVIAKAMPSDFLVVTPQQAKFVEVKEIWMGHSFPLRRMKQQYKLTKLANHYPNCNIMDGFVLLNFVEKKVVICLQICQYNDIVSKLDKSSLSISDVPTKFHFTWKSLTLEKVELLD